MSCASTIIGEVGGAAGGRAREVGPVREASRASDPVLRGLIDAAPDLVTWRPTLAVENLFEALLIQIVGQLISVSAMNAIHARLRACVLGGTHWSLAAAYLFNLMALA